MKFSVILTLPLVDWIPDLDIESGLEADCWKQAAINIFLTEVKIPKTLTEILVHSLERPDLDPIKMDNYCPNCNLSFEKKSKAAISEGSRGYELSRTMVIWV